MVGIRPLILYATLLPLALAAGRLDAQEPAGSVGENTAQTVRFMRDRAVAFLLKQRPTGRGDVPSESSQVGECALIVHALLNAGVPPSNETVASFVELVAQRSTKQFRPEIRDGRDNYEAGLACLALVEAGPETYREQIAVVARYLEVKQKPSGAWDYNNGRTGDTSMTQMALLGLWAASRAGVEVPSHVWESAARWLVDTQNPNGGFAYHPGNAQATHTMTAGALGSLYLCRAQLSEHLGSSELLERVNRAIGRGNKWFAENFTVTNPTGHFHYYFYSLERYAAFSGQKLIGKRDWYSEGLKVLQERQRPGGAWVGMEGGSGAVHTSFALLFLVKATHRTQEDTSGLGGGALLAGRGLPGDLSLVTVRRGQLVVPPIKVTLDELLDHLRAGDTVRRVELQPEDADAAHVQALTQLARDPDPEVRERAIWSLGSLRRYEVVPVLIGALEDPDGGVRHEARESLRRLSRKPRGFGLPEAPTPEQVKEAVEKWNRWYRSVRAYDEFNVP